MKLLLLQRTFAMRYISKKGNNKLCPRNTRNRRSLTLSLTTKLSNKFIRSNVTLEQY